jgi:hypothetical protein
MFEIEVLIFDAVFDLMAKVLKLLELKILLAFLGVELQGDMLELLVVVVGIAVVVEDHQFSMAVVLSHYL